MSRVDQEKVSVTVDGRDLGTFDAFSGGAKKAEATKNRPGGMGPEESLGGPSSRDDFTCSRNYKLERDHGLAKWLDERVGNATVVATRVMLGRDRTPTGEPLVFRGTLMGFVHPDHDSNSADRKTVALEVSADAPLG